MAPALGLQGLGVDRVCSFGLQGLSRVTGLGFRVIMGFKVSGVGVLFVWNASLGQRVLVLAASSSVLLGSEVHKQIRNLRRLLSVALLRQGTFNLSDVGCVVSLGSGSSLEEGFGLGRGFGDQGQALNLSPSPQP